MLGKCCCLGLKDSGKQNVLNDLSYRASHVTHLFPFADLMSTFAESKETKALYHQSTKFGQLNPTPKTLVNVGQGTPSPARWPGTWKPLRGTDCKAWRCTFHLKRPTQKIAQMLTVDPTAGSEIGKSCFPRLATARWFAVEPTLQWIWTLLWPCRRLRGCHSGL